MAHKVTASTGNIEVYVNTTDQVKIKEQLEKDGFENVEILEIKLNDKHKR